MIFKNSKHKTMTLELLQNGQVVGIEEHKDGSYFNKKQIRIHHSKPNSVISWDIKEWPERFIEHDAKRIISDNKSYSDLLAIKYKQENCKHENPCSAGGIISCGDCGFELVGW